MSSLQLDAYLPLLVIHVVWHPGFARGRDMAEKIYTWFARDPDQPNARGLGIPVVFRSAMADGEKTPPLIEMADARHSVVVVLVDSKMVIEKAAWSPYVAALWSEAEKAPDRHRVFPVAFAASAFNLMRELNFIRLHELTEDAAPGHLLVRLTNEISRLITRRPAVAAAEAGESSAKSPPRMRLFLSHAKVDGEKTALALRDYIHAHLALDTFFDAIDIAAGFRFPEEIDGGIDSAAFALIHTDAYASRVWCQYEVIRAKRHSRPAVVIHALDEGEPRSFPYIGNVPTIRWQPERVEAVIGLILREVLRSEYFTRHFENLKTLFEIPPAARALSRAPELLTALALRADADQVPYFVYPDPPLAKLELDLILELAPNLRLTTPTLLFANPKQPDQLSGNQLAKSLLGRAIGISISDSGNLAVRGMGFPKLPEEKSAPPSAHLRDTMTEFARFLLAAGATLAYGGDLRQGGFTLVLCELVAAYRAMSGESTAALQSYLSWPIHLDLTEDQQADWSGLVDFHIIPPPAGLSVDPLVKPPTTPEGLVAWARSLTAMREQMNSEIDARVLIGGQIGSFGAGGLGRYPGLAEEALLAFRAKKPVYLIGAFGGCTEAIIEALRGHKPAAFTEAVRLAEADQRAAADLYNSSAAESVEYAALTAEFESVGIAGLNNGLSVEENERLFTTTRLPSMIALVLRGLSRTASLTER
ncbi:MAG: TIR domain-containing protein [Verrucomicrobiota bacterium]